jgi:hypothetical protein
MVPVTVDQLTDESSHVFAGNVAGFQSCASGDPDSIVTRVTMVPDRFLKGTAGKTVRLTIPGGTFGTYRLGVGTSPEFTAGERVVVFADQAATTSRLSKATRAPWRSSLMAASPARRSAIWRLPCARPQ